MPTEKNTPIRSTHRAGRRPGSAMFQLNVVKLIYFKEIEQLSVHLNARCSSPHYPEEPPSLWYDGIHLRPRAGGGGSF